MINFGNTFNRSKIDIQNIEYTFTQGLYTLNELGHPFALVNFQYYPLIWTVKDKSFLAWMQRDGEPYNNESMVIVFDHNSKKISQSFAWGEITPPDADVHLQPTILSTNDNKIVMLVENPHDGPINIKKSGLNYDVSNVTNFGSFGSDLAYPHTNKLSNGDLYSVFRGSGGIAPGLTQNYTRMDCYKSSDNGENWSLLGAVGYDEGDSEIEELWYPQTPYTTDKIRVFLNRRRRTLDVNNTLTFTHLYYLESEDGITWTDITGNYRWNIENGPMPMRLMDDHFLALIHNGGVPTPAGSIKANGSCINNYGHPMAIVKNETNFGLKLLYWSGSAWIEKPITVSGRTLIHGDSTILFNTISNDLRAFITEQVGDYTQISEFISTNFGDTWQWRRQITEGNVNFINPHLSGNFKENGYGLFAAVAQTNVNYSDLFIKEIM